MRSCGPFPRALSASQVPVCFKLVDLELEPVSLEEVLVALDLFELEPPVWKQLFVVIIFVTVGAADVELFFLA